MTFVVGHPVEIHAHPQSDIHHDGKKMEGIREMSREEWDISRSILGCNQLGFLPVVCSALTVNAGIAITDHSFARTRENTRRKRNVQLNENYCKSTTNIITITRHP